MLNHYYPDHFSSPTGGWTPPGAAVAIFLLVALVAVGWVALSARPGRGWPSWPS